MFSFKKYESIYHNHQFIRQISIEQEIIICDRSGNSVDCRELLELAKKIKNTEFQILRGAGIESLEIVLQKPQKTIQDVEEKFLNLIKSLTRLANRLNIYLVGLGLPPRSLITKISDLESRYQVLLNCASDKNSAMLASATASNQVTIDVKKEEIIDVLNVFNGFSGFFIAFFANSAIYNNKILNDLCGRQTIWKAADKKFIFMPPQFNSLNEYFNFVCKQNYNEKDFSNLERSVRMDCRFRRNFKSVEIRMACQQFPRDSLVVGALSLGLIENIKKAKNLLKYFKKDELLNLKNKAVRSGFCEFTKKEENFAIHLITLAKEGLSKRKNNEEKFLKSLEKRVKNKISPANISIAIFRKNGIESLVQKSSWNYYFKLNTNNQFIKRFFNKFF